MGTGTINSLTRRKDSLILKHKTLDNDIKTAYSNHINDIELHKMKKEKLSLKEEIVKLETNIAERKQ
tara:strand:+ start:1064 stop:1264 length:201 start_codon:yes stop_codon:yes gene_type:complete